jgi:hypothetical protein
MKDLIGRRFHFRRALVPQEPSIRVEIDENMQTVSAVSIVKRPPREELAIVEEIDPIQQPYFPGTQVIIFDSRSFKNDIDTPLSVTMKKATVLKWYGKKTKYGLYDSLIDVQFENGRESKAHFADPFWVTVLETSL